MAKIESGHYHCLECGTLFESAVVSLREQRCPVCENPPTGKFLAGTEQDRAAVSLAAKQNLQSISSASDLHGVSQDSRDIYEATLEAQGNNSRGRVKRTKRKEKKNKKLFVFIGVWVLMMIATIFLVKHFSADEDDNIAQLELEEDRENKRKAYELRKKRMIIQSAVPECEAVMTSFLNSPSAAAKAQYVYEGSKLSGVMTRHYRNNPSFSSTRSIIKVIWADMLKFEDQQVIGAVCSNSLGEKFEVIFVNSENEWKIDWLSLVRYDPISWSLFQAGADGDEGEFRLYMRVRDSNKDLVQKEISVVFYKPGMYIKNEYAGLASSPVLIKVGSPLGKKIEELLEHEEGANDAYGFPIGEFDPPGYHRVRVRMKLNKNGSAPSTLELLDIIDTHWYGIEQVADGGGLDSTR
ncbi:MAG: hypothetical protein AB8F34_02345 [Akkermansiaceae bacterium]